MTDVTGPFGNRINSLDISRGLAIILVVYGHMARGVMEARLNSGPILSYIDFVIYSFHMPLFFAISGYLSLSGIKRNMKDFSSRVLAEIVYPYFLWSLLMGLTQIALGGKINDGIDLGRLLEIPWHPIGPFWFLYALLLIKIAEYIVGPRFFIIICIPAYMVASILFDPETNVLTEALYFSLFFGIGIFAHQSNLLSAITRPSPLVGALLFLAWIASSIASLRFGVSHWSIWCFPLTMVALVTAMSSVSYLTGSMADLLQYFGRNSMSIYLLHIFFTAGTRTFLLDVFHVRSLAFQLSFGTMFGLAGPLALRAIAERVHLLGVLGLGRDRLATAAC